MSKAREALALRKELLVARSTLHRLRVSHDVRALREGMSWPFAAGAWATSPPVRLGMLALAMLAARRGSRLLGGATVAMGLALLAVRVFRPASAQASVLPRRG